LDNEWLTGMVGNLQLQKAMKNQMRINGKRKMAG
jgi:hypothetical protein